MARFRPRVGVVRFVAAVLIAGAALIGSTGATAGPGVSTTTPVTFGGMNPCTFEPFIGTGNLHFLISDNLSNSGRIQFHSEANFSGLQAVTVPGNKKYVVIDQENQTDTFDSDGMPAHDTLEHTLQFIRIGEDGTLFPDDDFYEHFLAHITANANGTVTVNDFTADSRCR